MRELSLFTGLGGGIYGSKLLGWKTVAYVEWEPYCQKIIAQRIKDGIFDRGPIFGDVRTFADKYAERFRGLVDVVSGGFPCQPFSLAGRQQGADDPRDMWPATLATVRAVRPPYCFLENVPGLLGKHRYFEKILKDLSEEGYDVRWTCLSAAEVGAPHVRNRLWILATNRIWGRPNKRVYSKCEMLGISESGNICSSVSDTNGEWQLQSEGRKQNKRQRIANSNWWATEPELGRVAHGIPNRRDRLKAIGNGQVPLVVATAWRILTHEI